jgi:hypothetical protein
MAKHALRDKREMRENLKWYKEEKEKEKEKVKTSLEMSSTEWFEWFITTEEYTELIKTISQDPKTPNPQTSLHSAGESGSA